MKVLILILILLTGCSTGHWNYSDNTWRPAYNRFGKVVCPKGYHYNVYKDFCFHDVYEKNN